MPLLHTSPNWRNLPLPCKPVRICPVSRTRSTPLLCDCSSRASSHPLCTASSRTCTSACAPLPTLERMMMMVAGGQSESPGPGSSGELCRPSAPSRHHHSTRVSSVPTRSPSPSPRRVHTHKPWLWCSFRQWVLVRLLRFNSCYCSMCTFPVAPFQCLRRFCWFL